jgi:(p)ppGpp synthase/HD superfamily hydrolase
MRDAKKEYERINFVVDPELRAAIKKWRHQQEIDTEGEAVRQLLRQALQSNDQPAAA